MALAGVELETLVSEPDALTTRERSKFSLEIFQTINGTCFSNKSKWLQ